MRVFLVLLCHFPAEITMDPVKNIFLKSRSHAKKLSDRPTYAAPDPTPRLSKILYVRAKRLRVTALNIITTTGLARRWVAPQPPPRRRTLTCRPCLAALKAGISSKSRAASARQRQYPTNSRRAELCATTALPF